LGAGASFAAVVVEQDGFFDAGELVEQFADRHVHSVSQRIAIHTPVKDPWWCSADISL
jgi:hypothetical protein